MVKNTFYSMAGEQMIIDRNAIDSEIGYEHPSSSKIPNRSIYEFSKETSMPQVLDLISRLEEDKEITLKAKGNSISNAITIANILTKNHLEENSNFQEPSEIKPTIEMVIKITNS